MTRWLLLLLLAWCAPASAADTGLDRLVVLSYHDVREVRLQGLDNYTIEAAELVNQFAWLKENGYRPVSLQQVIDASRGGLPLPEKPVLLTFDDGYRSFYTLVYPLLQLYDYPAVLAVVGRWLAEPVAGMAAAPTHTPLLGWDEVRIMTASGLVEVASHSYDLHRGVRANEQGNEQAAAATRRYDGPAHGGGARGGDAQGADARENESEYLARVRADLARNASLIERETGRRPRAMVWPYGAYNGDTERLARELGMPVSVSLGARSASGGSAVHLGRVLIQGNPTLTQFAADILRPYPPTLLRGAHINLDAVYDADPQRQEEKLSRLIDRVAALGLNTIYLSCFHDADGDGQVDAAYFPTREMPVRADLLGRAAWQLHTRANAQVFAWLPVFGLQPKAMRMTDLDAEKRRRIIALFQDLGRYAAIDGLLFRDEPGAGETPAYEDFVDDLLTAVKTVRAPLATARSMGLRAATEAGGRERASPELSAAIQRYDHVLVRAAPATRAQQRWLGRFARHLPARADGGGTVVFDLPAAHADIAAILQGLQLEGAGNLSYGPDEFWHDQPRLATLRPVISNQIEAK